MVKIDDAEAIRKLAYEIWEREGCPSGREHEHWAEANRVHASRQPKQVAASVEEGPLWDRREAERQEIEALRRALWTPEPFSAELFGRETAATRPAVAGWRRRSAAASLVSSGLPAARRFPAGASARAGADR
ncbi:DUF2934 domain-containing protein [Jiella sp. M17.18]|uniref:DUF2934 domain-containing protein n=1 Tax=Jiella sp. M17.18 TaxID=3234247 RepID=UPI0034DFE27F